MNRYDDIIDLPHYEPRHPRMSMENRAAQFAPFAALNGHGSAIAETARLTDEVPELSYEDQVRLSRRLLFAFEKGENVGLTYFQPDRLKAGGRYLALSGRISKIDETERIVRLSDGRQLLLDCIIEITGHIFDGFD